MNYDDIAKKVEKITAGTAVPENLRELLETGVIQLIASSFYVENMQKLPKNVMNLLGSTAPTGYGMRITFRKKQGGAGGGDKRSAQRPRR